jgi:hypothetical protein
MGYGQSYYTLRSIFCDNVPPPAIHVHLRMFDIASEVPIATTFTDSGTTLPQSVKREEAEKEQFDLWLRQLWQDKDHLISRFHETGSFVMDSSKTKYTCVEIPMELRRKRDILDAFCFCGPAVIGYIWAKLRQSLA